MASFLRPSNASPSNFSDAPIPYASAVSKKLIPNSKHLSTIARETCQDKTKSLHFQNDHSENTIYADIHFIVIFQMVIKIAAKLVKWLKVYMQIIGKIKTTKLPQFRYAYFYVNQAVSHKNASLSKPT